MSTNQKMTTDAAYEAVAPDDFPAMMDVDRYGNRSTAAGIVTERTAPMYAAYVDMAELYGEGDRMVGDDIAEEGIKYLQQLNGAGGDAAIFALGATAAE